MRVIQASPPKGRPRLALRRRTSSSAAVWGAWFTWNAYRPIYRPAGLATVSFFAGWLTAELPFHTHEIVCDPPAYARLAAAETRWKYHWLRKGGPDTE